MARRKYIAKATMQHHINAPRTPLKLQAVAANKPQLVRKQQTFPRPNTIARPAPQTIQAIVQATKLNPVAKPQPAQAIAQNRAVVPKRTNNLTTKAHARPPQTIVQTQQTAKTDNRLVRSLKGLGKGRILIIVGNGPSVGEIDIGTFKDRPNIDIMSINTPLARVWPTKYWAFFDNSQRTRHSSLISSYSGLIFSSTMLTVDHNNRVQLKSIPGNGFSTDLENGFYIGRSSVYAAMQIGLWLNYDHIYIFGVDMTSAGSKMYFYGENPDVKSEDRRTRFNSEAEHYEYAANILPEDIKKRFTFCSRYLAYPFAKRFGLIDHTTAVDVVVKHSTELEKSQ